MRIWATLVFGVATTVAFVATTGRSVRADDPVTSSVRFNKEVIRIFQRKCLSCHVSNGLMMTLANYRDARAWGRAIREELVEQRMPPWSAAPGYGRFRNDLGLTSREALIVLTWLDGGMPKGDDRDLPATSEGGEGKAPIDAADLRLSVPAQTVAADEDLVVRRVILDTGLTSARAVERVTLTPGDKRVLRGAVVYVGDGWVGAWLPWQASIAPPATHSFQLPAGARLTVMLYYRGADGQAVEDRSTIGLHFTDAAREAGDILVQARATPPRAEQPPASVRLRGELALPAETTVWALQPVVDESATSLELRAQRPDGSVEVLVWMPAIHHGFPQALVLQEPVLLPAGTVLTLTTHHDAKAAAPSSRVTVGVLR